jgi:hypothetical protein
MGIAKDQWLRETGGFRASESRLQFLNRVEEIRKLRVRIKRGKATLDDVDRLSRLLGVRDYRYDR